MKYPIPYSCEQIHEAMLQGGNTLHSLTNKLIGSLLSHTGFKTVAHRLVLRYGGTKMDAEDNLIDSLAIFWTKLTYQELQVLPGETLPRHAARVCLQEWSRDKPSTVRLTGAFYCPVEMRYSSEEIGQLLNDGTAPAGRDFIQSLTADLKRSTEFLHEIHDRIIPEQQELQPTRKIIDHGLEVFTRQLEKGNYLFTADHIIPSYILGIAKNLWLNKMKKQQRQNPLTLPQDLGLGEDGDIEHHQLIEPGGYLLPVSISPVDFIEQRESHQALLEAIRRQDRDCPKYLELKAKNFSNEAIAAHFGVALQTVQNQLSICRKKLRDYLRRNAK